MTKIMFWVVAVGLCAGFYASGCEENDGCQLTRLDAARRVCLATVEYCEECVDGEAPICEGLTKSYCETVNKYPDDGIEADDCVDMENDPDCAFPLEKIDEYPMCSDVGIKNRADADSGCLAYFKR